MHEDVLSVQFLRIFISVCTAADMALKHLQVQLCKLTSSCQRFWSLEPLGSYKETRGPILSPTVQSYHRCWGHEGAPQSAVSPWEALLSVLAPHGLEVAIQAGGW